MLTRKNKNKLKSLSQRGGRLCPVGSKGSKGSSKSSKGSKGSKKSSKGSKGSKKSSKDSTDIYTRGDFIARGTHAVYEAIMPNGNKTDYVVKEVRGTVANKEHEFALAKLAGDLGIGPKVMWSRVCADGVGFLVMERIYGFTLDSLKSPAKVAEYRDQYVAILDRMYDAGLMMHDRNLGNFMFGHTRSHPTPRLWIIDYDQIERGYAGPREYGFWFISLEQSPATHVRIHLIAKIKVQLNTYMRFRKPTVAATTRTNIVKFIQAESKQGGLTEDVVRAIVEGGLEGAYRDAFQEVMV